MKQLALSVFNNIKNLESPSNETIRLILNHIPKGDYETMDHLYEMIDDQVEWSIEDYIELPEEALEKAKAKAKMDFWKEVYEVATLNFNGVVA